MRDWMETNLPCWVIGLIDWPRYRLFSRCWVCGRPMVLHSPWVKLICEMTPLPIEFTAKGEALLRQYAMEGDLPDTTWQIEAVVPVTARGIA